ncbi:hypothetical protein H7849_26320 [Alloacidobacterium dinghuense]|uniref:Peptidase C-terminal archaeal/bacterial domain-containing protein n=1 Tax=Alloacidobacterium dinghuense TaxID=2763107 RepID=A0A7G8BIS2_9BACT|nr:hypothetical protein [Alloacidobacterium dinghuense]QNI32442.1 hypothetical protein H7849_26320 [Alloacidobacterium dinghuense]
MRTRTLLCGLCFAAGTAWVLPLHADEPIIPPSVTRISPAGMERGSTATFTVEGRNLSDAKAVTFDVAGVSGKVTEITDVPEKITGPRAGEDLAAQVPLGKKQTAKLEVTAAKDVPPGIHHFRIQTPLGTSDMVVLDIGALTEIPASHAMAAGTDVQPQQAKLPATFVGTIASPGDKDSYQFEGKAGEDVVFQVEASRLRSLLQSKLVLSDMSGHVLAEAGTYDEGPDAELHYKLPQDGPYLLSITDREQSGSPDHFYRVDAGVLPYVTGVFPLGVRAGQTAEVSVQGVNLGAVRQVKVEAPKSANGWATIPLEIRNGETASLNTVKLAVGNEPEILEKEPNSAVMQAQDISLPVTINGHIAGGVDAGRKPDEDYFRFHAKKGERLSIDVAAARLGSPLDSVIEVLDAQGNPIPRATIRCLNQTTTTLADRDSRTTGIRLVSTSGLREGDYLMVGDELNRVKFIPDQPDADTILEGMEGRRLAYAGTSPDVHAVNTPVYKAQILPADAEFPPNGLPVFHLTWRNDDGGPGYGADSKLDFVAPADGDYLLHLKDVRGMEGPDFAYRLTVRDATPDYQLSADPANPNIPRGGSLPVTVSISQIRDYEGPIEVEGKGLPSGVTAKPAVIPSGQKTTVVVVSAASDGSLDTQPAPIEFVGHANVDGHDLMRIANADADGAPSLQLVSIIPPPDVVVTTELKEVSIEPGKEVTVTLHVERQNGFKGRVPCSVENLPPGIEVVNVGLNGVLVTEAQTSRTFTLRAEDWVKPIEQPIYVVGQVESNSPTMHASAPVLLKVASTNETASASPAQAASPNR